ncbi:MAG: YfhO family protein [Lachnospiraceae bacterium]|nr:YfhO family protein [Lachnospiraceae bacterium]
MNLKKFLNKETILYTIFGVLTTVVDFAVVAILYYIFSINEIIANTIAWIFAVATAYITNKLFVFESKSFRLSVLKHELPSFILARVFSLIVTDIFLAFASIINLNVMIAKLLISVFVIVSNYIFSKLFIFKKKPETEVNVVDYVTDIDDIPLNNATEDDLTEQAIMESKIKIPPLLGPLFLAFIIPVLVLSVIFVSRGISPIGDSIYLRSDMYHQYAPFYKELYRKLTEGGSLFYSWNIGMGVNFTALFAYYLASPINMLLGAIAIKGDILLTMDALIVFKTGLAGLTFAYYIAKHFNKKNYSITAISVFYALSSYMAAFSWNIMWIDCIVMLPLIALGIENLVKKKKWLLYTLSLGFAIYSNYYIGIMLCIFSVLYFFVVLFSQKKITLYGSCVKILHFVKGSLLAGGLGAVMFLPALYALSYTASADSAFPTQWKNYFSVMDMLARSLMTVDPAILNANQPNIYCTVAVFIMIPLYCLSKKIEHKEKVGKVTLLLFLLLSFNMNIPNFIWHGLHFPNSLPCRESFIYIFLILTMTYEAATHIKSFKQKEIYSCFFGALAFLILIEQLYVNGEEFSFKIIYLSLFFMICYLLLINMYRNKHIYKQFTIYMLVIVCIAEAAISSNVDSAYKLTGYSSYLNDNEDISNIIDSVESDDFYRIEKLTRRTKNDAAWNDYHGVSIFSSTANGHFSDLLGSFGFEKSTNAYSYYGNTPLTSSMLSVRYVISVGERMDPYLMTLKASSKNQYLYELDYVLPLGYMIPENCLDDLAIAGNDPFLIQNNFAMTVSGNEGLYKRLTAVSSGASSIITVEESCDLYIYVTNYVDKISYSGYNALEDVRISGNASGLNHRQIVHIGHVPANTEVTVTTSDTDVSSLQLYAYAFNQDVFDNVFNSLNDEGLEIESYDDTYIKGSITAKEDGTMLTSIIYDKGWSVYIDGEKTEIGSFNEALLTVNVPEGTHTIEFKYTPNGLYLGLAITIVSIILIFAIYIIERIYKKKERKLAEN